MDFSQPEAFSFFPFPPFPVKHFLKLAPQEQQRPVGQVLEVCSMNLGPEVVEVVNTLSNIE